MNPKISIIIPTYNGGKYIEETLNSIFEQNYRNIEVIIQDGGSSDNSISIFKKYANKYKCLVWESKKDNGQLDAITKGIRKSNGDIIGFINSDDVYLNGSFNKIATAYTKNPKCLWIAGQGIVTNSEGKEIAHFVSIYKNLLLKLNKYHLLLMVNYLMQPSVFFTKQAYKKYGPFIGSGRYVLEYDMWLKLGRNQMPALINSPLSAFRLRNISFSVTQVRNILKEDATIAKNYTNSKIIFYLHLVHNYARLLFTKF